MKLYCPNDPIVESSSGLTLSPYNLKWSPLETLSQEANLIGEFTDDEGTVQQKLNHWREVHDFTPSETDVMNYQFVEPDDFQVVEFSAIADEYELDDAVRELVTDGDFLYELPVEFGGTLDQAAIDAQRGKDGLKAFDIKAGREAAAKEF